MTNDDLLYRHRVQLFALAQRLGVTQACRELGYHRSTYYRWKPLLERHGLEILRPRERRPPRMPNQVPPWMEERVVAFALGHPGLGPAVIPPHTDFSALLILCSLKGEAGVAF